MTKSEMFRIAHARAKSDMAWEKDAANRFPEGNKYAYYFRLQLLNLYAQNKPVVLRGPAAAELFGIGA